MKQRSLLAANLACEKCHQALRWLARRQCSDGYSWKCINKNCASSWVSLRKGSFFEKSHISLKKWLHVSYLWCAETSEKQAAQLTGISERTIVDVYNYFCEVCSVYFRTSPVLLGGPGHYVHVDESYFSPKIKCHRGRAPDHEIWVFGIVDTSTTPAVGYMEVVPDRSIETLLPIIRRVVRPGSTVHSDSWAAYNNMQPALNFSHEGDNHTDPNFRFVSPTSSQTQHIESYWNKCKAHIKMKRGVLRDLLPIYLREFMWRDRFGKEAFNTLLLHIAEQFPV
ncbi:hypothetical protein GDO78_015019 [Eleutherodactylus coqui]|uniref:ISXO2-like transposase domain-containing protein n=1 Tax=Eleutherodactylus coqui TaxID=57060 RepID=A0A8J6JPI8_ELECQ|nr:hypothetical protein GDO78_015019 [Eleutherodactylus coqui]